MIPMDCVDLIVSYSRLYERYLWSVVHRDFGFRSSDWRQFSRQFQLDTDSREGVKEVCQRNFRAVNRVIRQQRHLWSAHLSEPLQIWSPWIPGKFCKRFQNGAVMFFRQYPFVNFVRGITFRFNLKTPLLRHDGVSVKIWKKTIPMVYISNTKRVKKVHITSAFKRFDVARVLIAFHVREQHLYLHPRRLEFLT